MQFSQFQANDYKYDLIAENVFMRESEWFHYDFDLKNFQSILATMAQDDPGRANYEQRVRDTQTQMKIVEDIHAALMAQITDQTAYQAAVVRTTAKREAQNG